MSRLILKIGNPILQNVNMVFPEGGANDLVDAGIKIINNAMGAGLMNKAGDLGKMAAKKLYGGTLFPGVLFIYSDKIVFEPSFRFISFLYQGIERVEIATDIVSHTTLVKKLGIVGLVEIFTHSGASVKVASYEGGKIKAAIDSAL